MLAWHVVLPTCPGRLERDRRRDLGRGDRLLERDRRRELGLDLRPQPGPGRPAPTPGFADGGDADTAALTGARTTGFPLTNLAPAVDTLKGDFADLTGPGSPGRAFRTRPGSAHSATRDYNFIRSDDRFEEASVYASITGAQSLIQSLGFTDANNRSIPVDVHYYSLDNSFYSSADHALHFGDGGVDDAEDADIVLHEYGHSIQDDQVPGFGPGIRAAARSARASGLPGGDVLLNHGNATYQSTRRYCVGDWDAVSYNPFSGANNGSGCLRWTDGTDEGGGADIGEYCGSPSEVHNDGRYWSAAMTCIFEGLGGNVAGPQQRHQAGDRPQRDARPRRLQQRLRGLGRRARASPTRTSSAAPTSGLINNCAFARRLIAGAAHRHDAPRRPGGRRPGGAGRRQRLLPRRRQRYLAGERARELGDDLRLRSDDDLLRHPGDDAHVHRDQRRRHDSKSVTIKRDATAPDTEITSGPKKKT